ncbi:ABC transporter ATP-binding protein [Nocardia sp. NPDC057353]|uniref:ABC transporter ATP-binding protein n=1 Tax=Nocardia sp. NPDC057353 TaxID=3346104 RepID=UPI003633F1EC
MPLLTIQDLGKTFRSGDTDGAGLRRLDLEIERGELISLLGPSGCGKTTTLRCIAGLETPDHGRIELDGTTLFAAGREARRREVNVPPERRGIGMVFQDYALWPHMDVFENVAFGLRGTRRSRAEISTDAEVALRSVRLWDHRNKRISQLSGGQQQRVALARALAPNPKIVLFDEPLSNLDSRLRDDMRVEILDLQRKTGMTAIWVTHDQDEALAISTRIVLMNNGLVEQTGKPKELWNQPASRFVAGFIGSPNQLSGTVVATQDSCGRGLALEVHGAPQITLPEDSGLQPGDRASIFIRPAAITISDGYARDRANMWKTSVVNQMFYGEHTVVTVEFGDVALRVRSESFLETALEDVVVQIDPSRILVFRRHDT